MVERQSDFVGCCIEKAAGRIRVPLVARNAFALLTLIVLITTVIDGLLYLTALKHTFQQLPIPHIGKLAIALVQRPKCTLVDVWNLAAALTACGVWIPVVIEDADALGAFSWVNQCVDY